MWVDRTGDFSEIWYDLAEALLVAKPISVGEVQSTKLPAIDSFATRELINVVLVWPIPQLVSSLVDHVRPNRDWAEEQFLERISGQPLNPPPSHERWPYAEMSNARYINSGQFDHTYPERFWPKQANWPKQLPGNEHGSQMGIRFGYGDLNDVALMLCRNEYTRQAYLPIFFPEDTGATQGQRIPCTLGYHFLYRDQQLHITYFIRSCDFWKHFRDDVYMAGRLCQWMVNQMRDADPELPISCGYLTMHTVSMHLFVADEDKVKEELRGR